MDIHQFVQLSLGQWRSQRSAHHLIFQHFEEVRSVIDIEPVSATAPEVIALCQSYKIDTKTIAQPFRMSWEGESDWDEDEELSGSTVLVPVPDPDNPKQGKLLRDRGYAETVPAAALFSISEDGTFTLVSQYDRASAEERIWFATPQLRFRVASIKTSDGTGVLTASFSSEIRRQPQPSEEKIENSTASSTSV
ncbi:phycobiliprotein lyase [Synechococcus sp. PCC 7336]|uniref:phycobiliprotein lyase n=1 Tax=Synechococcus sp. PCC 7336 TaxID=195250 RepID=UPI0003453A67|nr:phycobiliprotein lyase [Synechococcus sp. PCC 7336]